MVPKVNKKAKKSEKPQYLLLFHEIGGWKALHVHSQATDDEIQIMLETLKRSHPLSRVKLYTYNPIVKLKVSRTKRKPRWVTHPVKKPMKSSEEWLKPNERTAVCNECNCLGPLVPMTPEGNSTLLEAGWSKESNEEECIITPPGHMPSVQYTLNCPSCNEQAMAKYTREDWF